METEKKSGTPAIQPPEAKPGEIWGWSRGDEDCDGENEAGPTRADAIASAIESEEFGPGDRFCTWRQKVVGDDGVVFVSGDVVLDTLMDTLFEEFGEDAAERVEEINKPPARRILEDRLTAVLRAWLAENGVDFSTWFTMDDLEDHTVPEKDDV